MLDEYNLLARQAKAFLKGDLFMQALEEAKEIGGGDVMAKKAAVLAKGLEVGLASLAQ